VKSYIETERLILRDILLTDEQAVFELDSDPEVHRYLGNNPIEDIEEARSSIQSITEQYVANGIGRWAVIEKDSGCFVGWAGLKLITEPINNHHNYYDLGYRFIKRYWGKGYATEAAKASLDYGFTKMELEEIYGMALTENKASKHVLQKVGLTYIETFNHAAGPTDLYKIIKK